MFRTNMIIKIFDKVLNILAFGQLSSILYSNMKCYIYSLDTSYFRHFIFIYVCSAGALNMFAREDYLEID